MGMSAITTYNKCCTFTAGDAAVQFCANNTIAGIAGGHCP
jgi:hypothetical protein